MATIGDIWLALQLQGAEFQASAKKEGAKAGEAAGDAMSKGISGSLSKLKLGASFVQGLGIGAGIGAFHALTNAIDGVINAIPDMIHQGEDFAKTVDDISDATGSSAEEASRFAAAMIYTTGTTAGVSMGLKTLSKDLVANRAEFEKLGISITDANGAPRDTLAILEDVREFMATKLPAGYAKSALAIKLFGRSGLDFLDFLSMSNEQVGAFNSTVDAMGVTLSGPAVAAAEALAREQNLLGLAWQGLSNTLTTTVVPAIREAIGGLTQFIVEHGAEIRQTLVDITQAALGFVSGLIGIEGVTPFQDTLNGLAGSAGAASLTFEQWAVTTGQTIPPLDKVTTTTKGATDAIDRQIKSVEHAIEVEKKRDDASETIFQRTMRRLSAEYGAQLDALDLQERQLAMAERDKTLAEQLRQAKIALFEAEAQRGADQAAGKPTDQSTLDVAKAQQDVIEAQKAIGDEAAQRDRDNQRQRLEGVKSYIEDVAKIEADSENKKALASTLEKRRIKLNAELATAVAEKDATAQQDITARLEAVKTAETRTQTAIRNGDKQSELEKLKTQLEAERAAVQASGAGQVSDNQKTLAQLHADYDKWVAQQTTSTRTYTGMFADMVRGDKTKGTGIGGAATKAFADAKAAGEDFRKFLVGPLADAVHTIVDIFAGLVGLLKGTADELKWLSNPNLSWEGILGHDLTPPALRDQPPPGQFGGAESPRGHPGVGGGFAAGGPVRKGVPITVGEKGPEGFVPAQDGTIIPHDRWRGGIVDFGAPHAHWSPEEWRRFQAWFEVKRASIPTGWSPAPWDLLGMDKPTWGAARAIGDPRGWMDEIRAGLRPDLDPLMQTLARGAHHREFGGSVQPRQPYIVGERRPEIFVPGERGTILPDAAAAMAGWHGEPSGEPAIIRVEIGGNRLLDYIDQGLYFRRRRR